MVKHAETQNILNRRDEVQRYLGPPPRTGGCIVCGGYVFVYDEVRHWDQCEHCLSIIDYMAHALAPVPQPNIKNIEDPVNDMNMRARWEGEAKSTETRITWIAPFSTNRGGALTSATRLCRSGKTVYIVAYSKREEIDPAKVFYGVGATTRREFDGSGLGIEPITSDMNILDASLIRC